PLLVVLVVVRRGARAWRDVVDEHQKLGRAEGSTHVQPALGLLDTEDVDGIHALIIDVTNMLGIETSCDETAAALVEGGVIRSRVVSSNADLHASFGGVVPEIASRRHLELVLSDARDALGDA